MYHAPGRQYTQRAPGPPCPSIVGQRPALGGAQALAATRSQQRTPPQPPPKPWLAPRELNCGQQGSPHPRQQQPVAVRPLPQPQPAGAKHMLQKFQRVLKPHQQGQKVAAQFAYGPELDQLAYEQLAEEAGAYGHEEEASRGARYDNLSMKELINLCESMGLDTSAAEGKQDLLCLLDNVAIQYSGSLNSTSEILRTAVDSYGKNKETLRRCLDQLDSVIRSSTDVLGKQAPTDVLKQIPEWRKALELSECELLVLGDACAGKSSFLNLLLGQDILPNSALLCTPAICEIRYDKEPRLVARYQRSSQTIELKKRSEQEQRDVFTKFLNKANADQAQDGLEKVEVYLNSDILKSGAVLVDSPGLNDNDVLSDMVLDYAKRGVSMMVLLDMTRGFTKSTRDCLLAIKEARAFDASSTVFVLSKADLVDPSEREAKIEEILASLQSFHHDIERSSLFPLNVKAAAGALKVDLVVPDLSHFNAGFLALLVQAFKRKLLKYHIKASDVAKKMEILIQAGIKSAKLDRKAKLAMCILALRFLANAEEQAKQGLDRCLKIYEREIAKLCETLTKLLTRLEVREEIIRHASEMNLGITNSDDWNNAMQKAFLRALLLVAEKHMGKELSETRKNLKQEAFRFSDEVALIIKQAEAVLFDSAPVSHQGTQPAEDTSLGWGAYAAIVIMAPLWIPAGIIAAVVVVGINWLRKNRYAKWEKDPVQIQRKFAAKAMAEFTRKPVDESVVSFLLMQGGTFEDFVQNLTTYYRKTIEDLVAFLEKVKADDSPALGEKYAQLAGPVARIRWKLDHLYIHALRSSTIHHTDVKFKEQIGEGAFGNVFKAVLYPGSPEEQVVAVKRLKAAASTEAQNVLLLQLFAGEEATISSLKHPNIVHFIGSYIDEDHYYIVTEFVEAGTLGTCVPRQKKKEMLVGIISGLAYLHSLNIAHRDLKPQNILVTGSGVPKLTDFGLAKEERYVSGTLCGTPLYMAPEVLLGDYEAKSADVFSAAIIMWEVMFSRSYLDSLAGKPVNFKTLAEQRPQIPDGVDSRISDLLTQSWNANAHKRPNFATILQVLQAIPASVFAEL